MDKLPRDVDYRCLHKILARLGWEVVRQRGSHVRYRHPSGRYVTVPKYSEYSPSLLLKILSQIGVSRKEFIKIYEELC